MVAGTGHTARSFTRKAKSELVVLKNTLGYEQLLENHRLVTVEQDAIFDVPAHAAGEDNFLKIAAFLEKVFDRVTMGNADDVLFDDGAVVENFGDVVTGGADQLHAAVEGLMV